MNTSHGPTTATRTPAMAGPIARDTLIAMPLSATADCSSSGRTRSGTMAAHAGIASSITGMLSAASTRATSAGDEVSEVISQPAPTSCIHVPTFETIVAIQSPRKSLSCSGLQGDAAAPARAVSAVSLTRPPSRRLASERGFDRVEQRAHPERNVLDLSVDEERGRRANAAFPAALHVLADALQIDVIVHLEIVARHVELQPLRV